MRILSVNNSSDIYGASRCLERVFTRFAQEGHEVFVVLPSSGPLTALLQSKGVSVLFHPALAIVDRQEMHSLPGILRFLVRWPISALWLSWTILRLRIDLVHTNTAVMPSPAIAALMTGRPHVWHIREFFYEFGSLWTIYQVYMYLLSTTIIAMSKSLREQFSRRYQVKVAVIYDGLPADSIGQSGSSCEMSLRRKFEVDEPILIGVVGRIKWVRKGQEVLIEAFSRLHKYHEITRLIIIGSTAKGNEQHLLRLVELAKEIGVADKVTFAGELEMSASVYAALDITVVPSVQAEPFGCVVSESMAAGTVVVGSNRAGIAEQIVHGESGLLFASGDAQSLADCLDALLSNKELRDRLASGGKERVRTHFSMDQTYAATLQVFKQADFGSLGKGEVRAA